MKEKEKREPPVWEVKDPELPAVNSVVPGTRGDNHRVN